MTGRSLAAGLGAGAVAIALLTPAMLHALGDLAAARAGRAGMARTIAAPADDQPLLTPALRLDARTQAQAGAAVVARLRGVAARHGVLVEQAAPLPDGAGLVRTKLRVSGTDKAIIAYADEIERQAPLIRWHDWEVEALDAGSVRITGEVVAAWR